MRGVLIFLLLFLVSYNTTSLQAADSVALTFSIDSITLFDLVAGDDPSFEFFLEDIGGTPKTNSLKKYKLSTNLPAWKVEAKIDKVVTGVGIKITLGTPDAPYSGTSTAKTLSLTDQTVMTGTNGCVADSKSITYEVTTAWAPNAGIHGFVVTLTVSSN